MSRDSKGRFTRHKPLVNDGSALFGKCVRCVAFHVSKENKPLHGYCTSFEGFKEITGHTWRAGAPEGPCMEVHKLFGCVYWMPAW